MSTTDAIRSFYGRWARVYDRLATARVVRPWRERAAEALGLAPGDTVVEFGCGTGANLPVLRERVGPEGVVVGVDLTPGMLERARERVERAGWSNVHLVRGDATAAPVSGPVDAVLASFLAGLLPDPRAAVEDWLALLGPGGRAALLDARSSRRPLGRALNPPFAAFVRLANPGHRSGEGSTARALDRRVEAARDALLEGTERHLYDEFALGLVELASGRKPS